MNQYIVSESSDRSICLYEIQEEKKNPKKFQLVLKSRICRIEYNVTKFELISVTKPLNNDESSGISEPIETSNNNESPVSKHEALSSTANIVKDGSLERTEPPNSLNSKISYSLYCNETLVSFFRRPAFSPDGLLLVTPAGRLRPHGQPNFEVPYTAYIYTRGSITKQPVACLNGFKKPVIAVRFSPIHYELNSFSNFSFTSVSFNLPYRMVFAVACQDAVYIYDTQTCKPFYRAVNLHYSNLTDIAWNDDGNVLLMTSIDGFCSVITFEPGELGVKSQHKISLPEKRSASPSSIDDSQDNTAGGPATTTLIPRKVESSKVSKKRIAPTPVYP